MRAPSPIQLVARILVATSLVVFILSCDSTGPGNLKDSTLLGALKDSANAQALFDSLGPYDVIPLGNTPVSGTVGVTDFNDSVVVGAVQIAAGVYQPFRWRSSGYEMLSLGSTATSGGVSGINTRGDVIGFTDRPVVWKAGQVTPTPIFAPESTKYAGVAPIGISDAGMSAAYISYGVGGIIFNAFTGAVTSSDWTWHPIRTARSGRVLARYEDTYFFFTSWDLNNPTNGCRLHEHAAGLVRGMNNLGDFVGWISNTAGGYSGPLVVRGTNNCERVDVTPGYAVTSSDEPQLWEISDRLWIAGYFKGTLGLTKVGMTGWVAIDSALKRSGGSAATWRMAGIVKLGSQNAILGWASQNASVPVPVLLAPRR